MPISVMSGDLWTSSNGNGRQMTYLVAALMSGTMTLRRCATNKYPSHDSYMMVIFGSTLEAETHLMAFKMVRVGGLVKATIIAIYMQVSLCFLIISTFRD
jgi:hypothetical protein